VIHLHRFESGGGREISLLQVQVIEKQGGHFLKLGLLLHADLE
jgi:hypothetical protein